MEGFSTVGREGCHFARMIKESIFIRVNNSALNRNTGKHKLPHIWDVLFTTPELKFKNPMSTKLYLCYLYRKFGGVHFSADLVKLSCTVGKTCHHKQVYSVLRNFQNLCSPIHANICVHSAYKMHRYFSMVLVYHISIFIIKF